MFYDIKHHNFVVCLQYDNLVNNYAKRFNNHVIFNYVFMNTHNLIASCLSNLVTTLQQVRAIGMHSSAVCDSERG